MTLAPLAGRSKSADGLRQDIIHPRLEGPLQGLAGVQGGDHENRNRRRGLMGLQPGTQLVAGDLRKLEVEQDQVRDIIFFLPVPRGQPIIGLD